MRPGLIAIYALRKTGYRVHNGNLELPTEEQDIEIAGIVEQESGIIELADEFDKFIQATERWNESVEKIIGRQPKTGIELEFGKHLIRKVRGQE